jgi:hypothetical protein
LVLSVMIVAIITVHWGNGLLATSNGIELPMLYSATAIALSLMGFGPYSLDAALGIAGMWSPVYTWALLGIGVVGGVASIALKRESTAPQGV